jgi:predicted dehydrogenase
MIAAGIRRVQRDEDCLKWGIVGTGYMASTWADLLMTSRIGELHGVCSRSISRAQQFGKSFGCQRVFGSLEEMLAKLGPELDVVYVATPLESHARIIEMCIRADVNVLCEKPATYSLDEWLRLMHLAKERGVLLIEGMWMLCLPTFRQAESWIDSGLIGNIAWIRADLQKVLPRAILDGVEGEGVLMDYGVYALAFACHFLDGAPEWTTRCFNVSPKSRDSDWVIMAGRRGRTVVINLSANSNGGSSAAIIGNKGMIEWASPFNRTNQIRLRRFSTEPELIKQFSYKYEGFEFQLEEVTRSLRAGTSEASVLTHRLTSNTLDFVEAVRRGQNSHEIEMNPELQNGKVR